MKYLLDASAIYKIAYVNRMDVIADSITLDLARYELGNAVLKDCVIHKKIDITKAEELIGFLYKVLDNLDKVIVTDSKETMKIAHELNLSFYDAAYVQYSKTSNLTLITEDGKLTKKAKGYVRITDVDELLKELT